MSNVKKGWMLFGATVLSLSLTGCGGDDNAAGNNNNQNQGARVQSNEVRPIANNNNNKNNRTLRISDRAEQQVERLNEVDDAHVIISNNNAYVTIRLANDNNANNDTNNRGNNDTNGQMTNNRMNNNTGNARTFIENGTVDQNGDDGIINGRGDAGTRNGDNRTSDPGMGLNGNARTNDQNNNNAFQLGTENNDNNNNNARGTSSGHNYSEVSNSFEQKIADQVRQADKKIHKVYVSVNPDLYNQMNTYADDIRTNRNRDGLFEDFTNTINDFFGGRNGNR